MFTSDEKKTLDVWKKMEAQIYKCDPQKLIRIFLCFKHFFVVYLCYVNISVSTKSYYNICQNYFIQTLSIVFETAMYTQTSKVSEVGDLSQGRTESSLFYSYFTKVSGWVATPFLGWLLFTFDTYLILLSVKQGGIKYHF